MRIDIEQLRVWIEAKFSRSPGPGGQNVNKLNTQVTLLFDVESCTVFTDRQRRSIRTALRTRAARDGRIRVTSRRERSQLMNRRAAEQRLVTILEDAVRPKIARIATRPSARSKRRRMDDKRKRGDAKRMRRRVTGHD